MRKRIPAAFILTLIPLFQMSALTIFIDTLVKDDMAQIPLEQKLRLVSLENGVMETLFDAGHVFFNTCSQASDAPDISRAHREGADYYIMLQIMLRPKVQGISWKLHSVREPEIIFKGYSRADSNQADIIKKWTQLGMEATREILSHLGQEPIGQEPTSLSNEM